MNRPGITTISTIPAARRGVGERLRFAGFWFVVLVSFASPCFGQIHAEEQWAALSRGDKLVALARVTHWASNRPKEKSESPLIIGVFGKRPPKIVIPAKYEKTTHVEMDWSTGTAAWRSVKLRYLDRIEDAKGLPIVYVSEEAAKEWAAHREKLQDPNVLTVSETNGFLESQGMVQLVLYDVQQTTAGRQLILVPKFHPKLSKLDAILIRPDYMKMTDQILAQLPSRKP